ncbi:SPOR domain-containing protein [Yoonia sp. 208BN28-4]|uniref:SPOR domain-containing protein n=1 Tax=Yoonia sp. 208BN28-4 TaxID=3126505 RepID=UPI00309C4EA5
MALRVSALAIAAFTLSACDENGGFSFGGGEDAPVAADGTSAGPLVERDVEAPEIFSVTEPGLWDGRPSLGGVWVAHPDVTDPERVIIRNTANDRTVIGALFRRERDNPGPALQVSSDAAEELGVLAGSPSTLSVIALRREEAPEVAPPAVTDFETPPAVETASLDPIAGAAAAIDAAETASVDPVETAVLAPVAAPAPAPAPVATPTPVASSLEKPFVQIGIFSVEANANRTAERLRGDGLSTRVLAQNSQGRPFWRVIVGPAPTAGDRAAILDKVKALGFSDAYFVTN